MFRFLWKISGKLPDKTQLEVGDGQEANHHDAQSHMVLPEAPGAEVHTLLRQKLLPGATVDETQGFLVKHAKTLSPWGQIWNYNASLWPFLTVIYLKLAMANF